MAGNVEELSSDTEATLPSAAEQAAAAKDRGTALFAQKSPEGYRGALEQYTSAIELTPDNHLLYANRSACYAGLAAKGWQPREKCEQWAKALVEAKQCTELGPQWPKGFLRLATAQLELVDALKVRATRIMQYQYCRSVSVCLCICQSVCLSVRLYTNTHARARAHTHTHTHTHTRARDAFGLPL